MLSSEPRMFRYGRYSVDDKWKVLGMQVQRTSRQLMATTNKERRPDVIVTTGHTAGNYRRQVVNVRRHGLVPCIR